MPYRIAAIQGGQTAVGFVSQLENRLPECSPMPTLPTCQSGASGLYFSTVGSYWVLSMDKTLTLFDALDPHAAAADEWIHMNPLAFQTFCDLALWHWSIKKKTGAKKIVEDLRWDHQTLDGNSDGERLFWQAIKRAYKFNNNYTAQLARRAIEWFPQLEMTLTTRGRKHE